VTIWSHVKWALVPPGHSGPRVKVNGGHLERGGPDRACIARHLAPVPQALTRCACPTCMTRQGLQISARLMRYAWSPGSSDAPAVAASSGHRHDPRRRSQPAPATATIRAGGRSQLRPPPRSAPATNLRPPLRCPPFKTGASRPRRHPQPGRACPLYSSFGSMFVAIAMRFVRLYIALISATSQASSSVRPASRSVWRSSRVTSRGRSVSFSA
jgi:hypothetical protein